MAALLVVAALLAAFTNVVSAQETVVFSQIVHRHGSRSPIVPVNQSTICPGAEGCGALNSAGITMLTNLGTLIKNRYPSVFSGTYDYTKLYSRSTSVPRTMQSADAFLASATGTSSPVVFSVPMNDDNLLLSDSWPSLFFYMKANLHLFYEELNAQRKAAMSDSTVAAMAEELSLQGYCMSNGYTNCAILMYDVAASYEATGTLSSYTTTNTNWANLKALALSYFKLLYSYDSANAASKVRGSSGQPIAQGLIANMKSYIEGTMAYEFIHYSAHDSTVSPLGVTIGDASDEVMRPGFAIVMAFDLVEEAGSYYVRGVKATPSQAAGSGFDYSTPNTLTLGGIDANGDTYYASTTGDRIPFDDFVRFVDSTKTTSDKGQCAVTADELEAMGCSTNEAPTSTICTMYRTNCMAYACNSGYALDYSSLACVASAAASSPTMSTTNAGVMAMCTTLGGMLMGAGAMFAINHFAKKRKEHEYQRVGQSDTLNAV